MSTAKPREIQVVDSRVIGATIFSESAHVTRRAAAGLERGLVRVALSGLPSGLDPGALRVSTTRGVVRAIETDTIERKLELVSDTTALRRTRDALHAKLHRLAGEIEALHAERTLIDQVAPAAIHVPGGSAAPAALRPDIFLAGLDVLAKRRKETIARLRAAEEETGRTEEELAETERRLTLVGETSGADRKQSVLVVSLDVADGGDASLDLTYEAAWATWRPYYHVRLDGKQNTVECVRFADVWQETSEDWSNIKLKLSTAEPEPGLRVPAVLPWTLGLAKTYEDKLNELYSQRKRRQKAGDELKIPPPSPPRSAGPAPAASMQFAPQAAIPKARHSVFGALGRIGGGGGPPPGAVYDDSATTGDFDDDMMSELAPMEDSDSGELMPTPTVNGELSRARADDFSEYAKQFEEEGVFREITAAGVMAMRAQGYTSAATTVDGAPAPDWNDASSTLIPEPPPPPPPAGPGGPRGGRGPSPDHPDHLRLRASRLPRDSSGGINHEFEVGGGISCLSGKERQRLGFGSVIYPARIEYLMRPAITDHAFGRVTVVNSENAPLLAGPAAIFVGDAFFGETEIRTTPAGGKLVLDLGAETAIKCARRSKTSVRTEGILTKEDVHVVEINIDIENYTGQIAELEVQDQVPLSKDSKVKVRLVRTNPKDAQLDELTGILTFKVRAPSGSKTEIAVVYEIEVPKDYQIRQMLKG